MLDGSWDGYCERKNAVASDNSQVCLPDGETITYGYNINYDSSTGTLTYLYHYSDVVVEDVRYYSRSSTWEQSLLDDTFYVNPAGIKITFYLPFLFVFKE